jgi:hypothetical protein
MGLSRAPKGCPPVLHQPGSDQLSACLKRKPKQMHSRTTSILAITENRGEGFDAVQRAPHAKSIRLPCDRCRSRSDTNRSQEQINASHPGPQKIHTAARTPCMRTSLVRTKTFVLSLMSVTRPPPFPPRSPKRPGRAGARAAGTVLDKSIPQVFNGL